MNPNRDVYVLFVSPVGFVKNEPKSPIITALQAYSNIYLRNVNLYRISKNTPAELWIREDRIFTSNFFETHVSDYLRKIVLFKYGGIYLDSDFISVKSLNDLPSNFASHSRPDKPYINDAALGFTSNGIGHKMAEMALRYV